MMKASLVLASICLTSIGFAQVAKAGYYGVTTIKRIWCNTSIPEAPDKQKACGITVPVEIEQTNCNGSNGSTDIAFDITQPGGKETLTLVTAAYLAGKHVFINVVRCSPNQPSLPELRWVYVQDSSVP